MFAVRRKNRFCNTHILDNWAKICAVWFCTNQVTAVSITALRRHENELFSIAGNSRMMTQFLSGYLLNFYWCVVTFQYESPNIMTLLQVVYFTIHIPVVTGNRERIQAMKTRPSEHGLSAHPRSVGRVERLPMFPSERVRL